MYKVGLVEDEEALNKLIKNYLEKEDFIVETFTKGQDALDFINDKNNELLQREHKRIRAKIALITGC